MKFRSKFNSAHANLSLKESKEVVYYQELVNVFFNTKMERDKVILSIACSGIGLMATFLGTMTVKKLWLLTLYALSFLSFSITIILLLRIFNKNAVYVKNIIRNESTEEKKTAEVLRRLDKAVYVFFILGIVLIFLTEFLTSIYK